MALQAPRFSKTEIRGYNVIDGLKKIIDSKDPATSILRDVKIGKWTLDQVREWLRTVLGDAKATSIDCVVRSLSNRSPERTDVEGSPLPQKDAFHSKKRKYPENVPSFFGSTTISNRKRRYAQDSQDSKSRNAAPATAAPVSSSASESLTYGQKLIVLNFESLIGDEKEKLTAEDAKLLRDSLKSRLAFEAALDELQRLEDLQEWRLRTEKSSNRVQLAAPPPSAPVADETPSPNSEGSIRDSSSLTQVREP
jgi:hypothetical protein